uniref:Uncharacterized protein n=1 Tax=Aegilops tauschii TaxID=37682 RepID=M8BV29_AEGTA
MAMEPLPLGFGDAMDTTLFSTLWSFQEELQPQESVEELKQSLLAATMELEVSKEELRRKEQSIAKLADLVRQVAKERDEARDQSSSTNFQTNPEKIWNRKTTLNFREHG